MITTTELVLFFGLWYFLGFWWAAIICLGILVLYVILASKR